jgi:peroxiredoxin
MKSAMLIFTALVVGLTFVHSATETPAPLALGSKAPYFDLPGVDEVRHTLDDFKNAKVLVVVFTCNHCPTAQYYQGRLKKAAADYFERGVALVAISPNDPASVRLDELGWTDLSDTFPEMMLRAKNEEFNFPYLYDGETETASRAYGPLVTPHAFVFDQERKLRYQGAIDDSERIEKVTKHYLRDAIEALLDGKEPPITKTKVVGCSVKWAGKADSVKAFIEKLAKEPVSLNKADAQTLKKLRKNDSGKFRLVTFWATWCAPCVAEFNEFVTINRMYRHRDFELVTVSLNRPEENAAVLDFLKKKQCSAANYIFASSERAPLIDAFDPDWQGQVPFTVLIGPEGNIVHKESGSIDVSKLKQTIVKTLNAKKPW